MTKSLALILLLVAVALAADGGKTEGICCCTGVVIMILVAIGFNENRRKQVEVPSSQTSSGTPSGPPPSSFQIGIDPAKRDFGSGEMDCLALKMRGPVNLHPSQLTAVFQLTAWDVTLGSSSEKRRPLLCSIPEFQLKGSQVFLWTHLLQMPYAQSMLADWTEVIALPLDTLTFPARGKRKLEFELRITSLGVSQGPLNRAVCTHHHENRAWGYVDGLKQRIKAEELGLKLAAAVSAADGSLDDREKAVVRNWMDSRIESLPEDLRADTTRALSRALMTAERLGSRLKAEEVPIMVEELVEHYPVAGLPKGDLYDVVKLCMEVAAADGTAGPDELRLIDRISELLSVDRETFTRYRDKLLPAGMHSEKDIDSILGIDPSWNSREKKRHLRGLYREWSSRVTHSDSQVRDQAEEMLKLIAQERARLDAEE